MAIPSGSGTEVLKRAYFNGNLNTAPTLINGVANHIYTIISIIVCEAAGAAEVLTIYTDFDGSGQTILYHDIALPEKGTFVANDRFVLTGTDHLVVYSDGSSDCDVWISYIDQDWT